MSLLDEFSIEGPNGQHKCIVSEVVGASIFEAKEAAEYDMLPIKTARNITAQLSLGLAYIHSCGVLHGGQKLSFPITDASSSLDS